MALPTRNRRVLRSLRQAVPSGVILGRRSSGEGPVEFIPLDEATSTQLDAISSTQGAVLYRGAAAWAALPPGTAGQFLQTQGAAADPVWAGASGGGNGLWWFNPPLASDLGTAVSDGTVSGTSATDDADAGLVLQATIGATDAMWGRVMTAPSTPFTVTAHFFFGAQNPSSNAAKGGIMLRASSTGLRTIFGPRGATDPTTVSIRRATTTTFNAEVASSNTWGHGWGLWLRVVVTTATNIEYQISYDGKVWHVWQADTANGRVSGLDQIGLAFTRAGTVANQSLCCDYWDVA